MTIPKFRSWHKNEMTGVKKINFSTNEVVYDNDIGFYHQLNHDALMQSTGLFDRNGVEIFEGDVVKLKYTVLSDYEFFKVTRFRGGSWRIDNQQRGSELWLRNEDCEIVGNIYENPELVEVENE